MKRFGLLVAAVVLLAGCGGASGGGAGSAVPTPASVPGSSTSAASTAPSTTAAPSTSIKPAAPRLTYGSTAAQVAAALGCTGVHPNPDTSANQGAPAAYLPTADVLCTFGTGPADVQTFASAAAENGLLAYGHTLLTGFNAGIWVAVGPGWVASNSDPNAEGPATAAQRAYCASIVARIGGQLRKLGV